MGEPVTVMPAMVEHTRPQPSTRHPHCSDKNTLGMDQAGAVIRFSLLSIFISQKM
jgi:hypothetical protein